MFNRLIPYLTDVDSSLHYILSLRFYLVNPVCLSCSRARTGSPRMNQPNQRGKVILIQHFDLVLGTVFELVLPVPSDQINCWIRYPIDLLIYES